MPQQKYQVELSDGRKFIVEADGQPSEADILAQLGESSQAETASKLPETSARMRPTPTGRDLLPSLQHPDYGLSPGQRTAVGLGASVAMGGPAAMGAMRGATGVVGKAAAGVKAVAAPILKFEAVRYGLTSIGVPGPIADMAAAAVTGTTRGGKAAELPAKGRPARASTPKAAKPPIVTPPPAQAATTAPPATAAPAAPEPVPAPASVAKSPQLLKNEAGLGVRRAAKAANADFTKEQFEAAGTLVDQGMSPAQAVMQIKNAMRDPNAAAKLAEMLQGRGALSVEEMNAEIAARVGNRSPQRAAVPASTPPAAPSTTPAASTVAPTVDIPAIGAKVYHSSPEVFEGGRPGFDAFYGTEEFLKSFPQEFGAHTYKVTIPRSAKILDLNKSTPQSAEFMRDMAKQAFPKDVEFHAGVTKRDPAMLEDLYEVWTDKRHVLEVLKRTGYDGVKFGEELVIPGANVARWPSAKIASPPKR